MKFEYTKEDFKKGVRNPFYHDFCRDVTVGIAHEDYELYEKIAEGYGVTPEVIMKSALHRWAKGWKRTLTLISIMIRLKLLEKNRRKIKSYENNACKRNKRLSARGGRAEGIYAKLYSRGV